MPAKVVKEKYIHYICSSKSKEKTKATMKDTFDYQAVPLNYLHCFNENCPRKGECLRHLTALHAPKSIPAIKALNPAAYPADADSCPYFRSSQKMRLAWGMSTMFDDIPYRTAVSLKSAIHHLYPKTTYYRIAHQERPLSTKEQEEIARVFVQNGVTTPPRYDRYTEGYDWDEHSLPG